MCPFCLRNDKNLAFGCGHQTGKSSLGDALYRTITADYSSAENVLSLLDLSTEHIALEMANRLEAAIYTWKRRLHSRQSISIEDGKTGVKPSWSLVKESETELGKKELYMERAENILLNLKNKFPSIPQTFLDITKIQYNRDVGHSILESYSRVLESLAYNILSRINDVIREDDFAQASQRNPTAFVSADNEFTKPSVFLPSLRKHKTRNLDCCHFPSESPSPPLSPSSIGTPEPRLHHQADTSKLGALVGEALLSYVSRESCFSESDYKDASEELPTSARKSSVPISPRLANAWCYGKEVCRSLSCTNSP